MINEGKEQRAFERYRVPYSEHLRKNVGDVYFELGAFRDRPVDVSLKGIGIEIRDADPLEAKRLWSKEDLFLRLHFGEESVTMGVKWAWHALVMESTEYVLKAGMAIELISPADSLKLSAFIEKIRA